MNKQKFWLIVIVLSLTLLYTWARPDKTIHALGEVLIMGDTIFLAGVWIASCWLCVKILEYREDKRL